MYRPSQIHGYRTNRGRPNRLRDLLLLSVSLLVGLAIGQFLRHFL